MSEPIDFKAERKIIKDTQSIAMDLSDCDLQMAINVLQEINVEHAHPDETLTLRVARTHRPYVLRVFWRPETDKEIRHRLHCERMEAEQSARVKKEVAAREEKLRAAQEELDRNSIPALRERLARLEADYPDMRIVEIS